MAKRHHVDSVEDWGVIMEEVLGMMYSYVTPVIHRIEMGERLLARLKVQRRQSVPEFLIIWDTRISRVERLIRNLKDVLDMDVSEVLL